MHHISPIYLLIWVKNVQSSKVFISIKYLLLTISYLLNIYLLNNLLNIYDIYFTLNVNIKEFWALTNDIFSTKNINFGYFDGQDDDNSICSNGLTKIFLKSIMTEVPNI